MQIHCLQHAAFETPGLLLEWAAAHGHEWSFTHLYAPEPSFPALQDFDWLVVLGGVMGVDEENRYGWLAPEKAFIRAAMKAGKMVLGICLGAQLLADALGARVYRNPALEIGFWAIQPAPEAATHPLLRHFTEAITVLHWHGDTFGLPAGAVPIASSQACAHQGFVVDNRIVGLQFHPELTAEILGEMLHHDGHELVPGPWVQTATELRQRAAELAAGKAFLFGLLDQLAQRGAAY
ncbi:type 1 glutamine amidotransferase [Hymenobacter elongatus]|uniref:Type 1 glutamine amidotransferase n=1 Tax=Hymenobacter elongatus TaxID=877208 RepID=A0A4Z0PJG5_9BACT|nr:type 1 glutamine amidotransferase [Hymenobacter elongatus]TGE15438.1 type 1 glutamine amidotransferase [Hymenobacter elongatus]